MSGDGTFMTADGAELTVLAERPAGTLPLSQSLVSVRTADAEELSARRIQLVKDAHLRAEHQVHARNTMLELAEALEKASSRGHQLEQAVLQEQLVSARLREDLATWPPKVDKLKEKWDDARVQIAYWGVKASAREGAAFPLLLTLALEWRPIGERRSVTGQPLSTEESLKVDRLLLKEMLKSWYSQVSERPPEQRRQSVHAAAVVEVENTEEIERLTKLLEAEQEKNKVLASQLAAKNEEVKSHMRRATGLEDENLTLLRKADREREMFQAEIERLKVEIEKIPELVAKKEQAIVVLRQEVAEEKENTLRAKADAEEDRRNLMDRIQQLADELTNAINTSKHMKETAVKAMRQPGSCISPEKFAQLIMELEELKDQMRSIGSDRDNEKEAINSLRQQLRRNRRRWELERQFLPLLHQVKGPVGPASSQVKKDAPWAQQSVVAQAPEPVRMQQSKSSGAIEMQKHMASTNGFRKVRAG